MAGPAARTAGPPTAAGAGFPPRGRTVAASPRNRSANRPTRSEEVRRASLSCGAPGVPNAVQRGEGGPPRAFRGGPPERVFSESRSVRRYLSRSAFQPSAADERDGPPQWGGPASGRFPPPQAGAVALPFPVQRINRSFLRPEGPGVFFPGAAASAFLPGRMASGFSAGGGTVRGGRRPARAEGPSLPRCSVRCLVTQWTVARGLA